jgi:iron(III) transport system permease protein
VDAWLASAVLSLQISLIASAVGLVFGIPAAWACHVLACGSGIQRLTSKICLFLWVFAAVTPLILHAAAWESTAGKFGWWWWVQGTASGSVVESFQRMTATAWIHAVHAISVVAVAAHLASKRINATAVLQSRLDGGPTWRWWQVILPSARSGIIFAVALVSLLAVSEMTVADLYLCPNLAARFYRLYAAQPDATSVIITLAPTLISVVIAFTFFYSRQPLPPSDRHLIKTDLDDEVHDRSSLAAAWGIIVVVTLLVVIVPTTTLFAKIGSDLSGNWSPQVAVLRFMEGTRVFTEEYFWSLQLALFSGLVATSIAGGLARSALIRKYLVPWLIALFCIPGPIVGLAVVSFFRLPVPGFDYLYSRTLIPTLIATLPRTLPIAFVIIAHAYRRTDISIWQVSRLDFGPLKRWWLVERPLLTRTYGVSFLLAGVIASGDVAATLPVMPAGVTTIATRLFGLLHSGARVQEAVLALGYLAAVTLVFAIAIRLEAARNKMLE